MDGRLWEQKERVNPVGVLTEHVEKIAAHNLIVWKSLLIFRVSVMAAIYVI